MAKKWEMLLIGCACLTTLTVGFLAGTLSTNANRDRVGLDHGSAKWMTNAVTGEKSLEWCTWFSLEN